MNPFKEAVGIGTAITFQNMLAYGTDLATHGPTESGKVGAAVIGILGRAGCDSILLVTATLEEIERSALEIYKHVVLE